MFTHRQVKHHSPNRGKTDELPQRRSNPEEQILIESEIGIGVRAVLRILPTHADTRVKPHGKGLDADTDSDPGPLKETRISTSRLAEKRRTACISH